MNELTGAGQGGYALVQTASSEPTTATDLPVNQYRSLLAGFLLRLCVAVTFGVILLTIGELYSYWRYAGDTAFNLEPGVRIELSKGNASERQYWQELQSASKVTYHPYVLWRRAPFSGSMINVNAEGIRQTLHSQCNDKNFTVWMFGDSAMWGAGAADGETIPSYLAADYEQQGKTACVVNYGEKGWSNTQEVIELLQQLKHAAHKPDAVVFYDGGTEAFTAYQSGQVDVPSNYSGFRKYMDNWSAQHRPGFFYLTETNTHRWLARLASRFSPPQPKRAMTDAEIDSMAQAILQNYQQNMDIVGLLAQRFGFRTIFVWYPTLMVGHKPLTPTEQQIERVEERNFPGLAQLYRAAYRRCQETKRPNLYYFGDVFDDERDSLFVGLSHLTPEGNRTIADHLFQMVRGQPQAASVKSPHSQRTQARRAG